MTSRPDHSAQAWDRSAKLDAGRAAGAIEAETGVPLVVEGPCPGGQVGAAYVHWPDGHRGVLTWRPGVSLAGVRNGPLAVAAALRAAGYPAPAAELVAPAGDGVAVVQELLPGAAVQQLDRALLDQALGLNRRGHPPLPARRGHLLAGPGRATPALKLLCFNGPSRSGPSCRR